MSDRAIIGVMHNLDSQIDAIYLHNFGSKAFSTLKEYYAEPDQAWDLIKLGDLSTLGPIMDQNPLVKLYHFQMGIDDLMGAKFDKLPKETKQTIHETEKYFCEAYYRDRAKFLSPEKQKRLFGEVVTKPNITHFPSAYEFNQILDKDLVNYEYLYIDGHWEMRNGDGFMHY